MRVKEAIILLTELELTHGNVEVVVETSGPDDVHITGFEFNDDGPPVIVATLEDGVAV